MMMKKARLTTWLFFACHFVIRIAITMPASKSLNNYERWKTVPEHQMVLNGQCAEYSQFHDAIYPIDAVTFRGEWQSPSGKHPTGWVFVS